MIGAHSALLVLDLEPLARPNSVLTDGQAILAKTTP